MTEFAVLEMLYHKGPLRLGDLRDAFSSPARARLRRQETEQRGLSVGECPTRIDASSSAS